MSFPTHTGPTWLGETLGEDQKKFQELEELKMRLGGIVQVKPQATECFYGTRTNILSEVEVQTKIAEGMNIICIRGAPGSGKSSISLSIKSRLHKQGRLITYFRFNRNDASITTSSALWSRVAYDLADQYPSVLKHNLALLRDNKVNLTSTIDLFTTLVEEPLSKLPSIGIDGPLVIVIDALDECGGFEGRSSSDRKALLQTLGRWHQLPKYFKLIVTSRNEGDISRVLSSISSPIDIPSGHFLIDNSQAPASVEASKDIRTFLEGRFSEMRSRLDEEDEEWPGTKVITCMGDRAAGNFMWATAVANFIDEGMCPDDRLRIIMGDESQSNTMESLYSVYSTILNIAFGKVANDGSEAATLRAVLGTMVCAKRPLSDDEYIKLPTQIAITRKILATIRNGLGSIISTGSNLRFGHKSFDDFLLSDQCPFKFRIRMDESQYLLTKLSLTTMTNELHFNMCRLETSYLKNVDFPDIETKVVKGISTLLSYACCFWADHLINAPLDESLITEVKEMILSKLLYWFEAMSLLKEMNRVSNALLSLLKWFHPSPDDEFQEFIRDARRFIGVFIQPIAQSAPHIYISALPFTPEHSYVSRHFLPQFPRTISLSAGKPTDWQPCVFISEYHTERVQSITFSPDEKYFVSGSDDETFCICDSETGNLISGPFNTGSKIRHVFFDTDGSNLWTSNSDGRVISWDIEIGTKKLEFWAGNAIGYCRVNGNPHIVSVSEGEGIFTLWSADTGERHRDLPIGGSVSKVTLSPHGRYIAGVGSNGSTVRIWEFTDGSENLLEQAPSPSINQSKHVLDITALSFSVDGSFVVSGSYDWTVLIWDAKTGDAVGPPLVTRGGWVDAIGYFHENQCLVSASGDPSTVVVWNASTHEPLLGPLEGHTSFIAAITLSRDGRWALTGSGDGTVRKWNLSRKGIIPPINAGGGHTYPVLCVAFSPSGKRMASIDNEGTIRFWNADIGEPLLGPNKSGYDFSRIIFSPDGSKLVAYGVLRAVGLVRVLHVHNGDVAFDQCISTDLNAGIPHIAFRSADHRMITISAHGNLCNWIVTDNAMIEDFSGSAANLELADASNHIRIVAVAPDGLTAVVYDKNKNPHYLIWNTMTSKYVPLASTSDGFISGYQMPVAYSPSGHFFAVASGESENTLRVWNTETGELVSGPSVLCDTIRCMAFSPDDSHIAFCYDYPSDHQDSRNSGIWIWDVRTKRLSSGPWNGHRHGVNALVFSPDGKKLVSGSSDGQIRVWNAVDLLDDLQGPFCLMSNEIHMQDGWVMDNDGKLRCWVPKDHRGKLAWNGNIAVFGGGGIATQVDLTKCRWGENWTDCFDG